jgi:hypothetical protein
MVQVDVFWAYALSSGIALAAQKEIKAAPTTCSLLESRSFSWMLLWTALVFAPSGLYLLWAFPYWETMFVARSHDSIPAWLVTLFGFTNISQAILGYFVTAHFIRRGNGRMAWGQLVGSYFCFFFILIVGWDGTGWKRFLYAGNGEQWAKGEELPWTAFFSSPVFFTLLAMGVVFLPTYFFVVSRLNKSAQR